MAALTAADSGDPTVPETDDELLSECRRRGVRAGQPLHVVTTAPVTDTPIDRVDGARTEAAFLRSLEDGALSLVALVVEVVSRMAELVERYATLRLGATDASVVAVAGRLGIDTVATFDRRRPTVVRPHHGVAFTLMPPVRRGTAHVTTECCVCRGALLVVVIRRGSSWPTAARGLSAPSSTRPSATPASRSFLPEPCEGSVLASLPSWWPSSSGRPRRRT